MNGVGLGVSDGVAFWVVEEQGSVSTLGGVHVVFDDGQDGGRSPAIAGVHCTSVFTDAFTGPIFLSSIFRKNHAVVNVRCTCKHVDRFLFDGDPSRCCHRPHVRLPAYHWQPTLYLTLLFATNRIPAGRASLVVRAR